MREEGRGNSFLCFKNQPESLNRIDTYIAIVKKTGAVSTMQTTQ